MDCIILRNKSDDRYYIHPVEGDLEIKEPYYKGFTSEAVAEIHAEALLGWQVFHSEDCIEEPDDESDAEG